MRIGEYHVQVQIDSATDFSLDDSALYKTGSTSTRSRRVPPPKDLGASLAPRESARGQQRHFERRTQARERIRPGGLGAHARAASDAGPAEGIFDRSRARRRLGSRGAPHRAPGQGRDQTTAGVAAVSGARPIPRRAVPSTPSAADNTPGLAGVLPRRRHRPRNASRRCALAHVASRRPAVARVAARDSRRATAASRSSATSCA